MKPVFKRKIIKLVANTLIVLVIAGATAYGQRDTVLNHSRAAASYKAGKGYLNEKKFESAINNFVDAITLYPTDSAYANLGFAYIRKGDDKKALFALNKAIDLNQDYAWALGLRGYLYTKIDAPELSFIDFSKAIALNTKGGEMPVSQEGPLSKEENKSIIKDYTKEIDQHSTNDSAYVRRGQAYENQKNNKQAIRDYEKAIALNPENATAFYRLQHLYLHTKGAPQKNNTSDALADTTEQLAGNQQFKELYVTQGTAFSSIEEQYELIIRDYTKVIDLYPDNASAYRDRGYVYAKLKKIEPAIADFTSATKLDPQSSRALGNRGALYIDTNKPELAIADLTAAIKFDPKRGLNYYNRGLAYYQKGAYELAIRDFTSLIALEPSSVIAYCHRGNLYTYVNKPALAIADATKAIEIAPKDAESYAIRGLAYAYKKDYGLAIQDFTRAIQLNPQNATIYANRALAYKYQKNYKAAIEDYTKAIALDPSDSGAYKARGEVYQQLGKKKQAAADLKKAARGEQG